MEGGIDDTSTSRRYEYEYEYEYEHEYEYEYEQKYGYEREGGGGGAEERIVRLKPDLRGVAPSDGRGTWVNIGKRVPVFPRAETLAPVNGTEGCPGEARLA